MWQRMGLTACVFLASWLGSVTVARGQDLPPAEFTGPLTGPRPDEFKGTLIVLGKGTVYRHRLAIEDNENWICYGYADLSGICFAGLVNELFLGSTPMGAFAAFADVEATALESGPGFGVNWYVWEGITTSLRWDMLRGLTVTTTLIP